MHFRYNFCTYRETNVFIRVTYYKISCKIYCHFMLSRYESSTSVKYAYIYTYTHMCICAHIRLCISAPVLIEKHAPRYSIY